VDAAPSDRDPIKPDLANAEPASLSIISGSLTGLFVLGLFYTAYFARALLIPITMALILNFVLAPLARALSKRLRLPHALAAGIVVVGFVGTIVFAFSILSTPAADWMVKLPNEMGALERKLRPISGAVQNMQDAAKQVEDMAQGPDTPGAKGPLEVVVRGPSLTQLFLGQTMSLTMGILVTFGLLLFLLASGDALLRQAVTITPKLREKKKVVEIARETEDEISHYLASITLINVGVGLLVGLAMWALGMPNPMLWGVMAGLLNFVPFVGGLVSFGVISLVAIITFEAPLATALPPLAFLLIHLIESQLLTPILVSRRLLLNPVAVLLSLIVWTWMWGIPGTLLAVPILAAFKIVCERVEGLHGVAVMLTRPSSVPPPPEPEPT
jgi:predicted PurR-regulated permease PerM